MERFTNSLRCSYGVAAMLVCLPIGTKVVHFWGSYLEFYKVFPKRSYFGAYGYWISRTSPKTWLLKLPRAPVAYIGGYKPQTM